MGGVNRAIILGRLGRDPEVRDVGRGDKQVCNLSVATSKKIKGEEKTEWHRVTIWSETSIKYLNDYAVKGSLVYIEGELETRKYVKDGVDHYATDIVVGQYGGAVQIMSDFKDRGDDKTTGSRARKGKGSYEEESRGGSNHGDSSELDDEIPF